MANCTKQVQDFVYRIPEDKNRCRLQTIPVGAQIIVHTKDASLDVLMGIVAQHEPYGLVDVKDIPKTVKYIGLCYSFDKPIDMDKIMHALHHNDDVLTDLGLQIRKDNAVSLNHSITTNEDAPGLIHLEVETIEDTKRGEVGGLNERIEVVREGDQPRGPSGNQSQQQFRNNNKRRR